MPAPYIAKRRITDALGNTAPLDIVLDNLNNAFSPGSCSHAYTYDGSGNVATDIANDGTTLRTKTFVWTTHPGPDTESKWVVT